MAFLRLAAAAVVLDLLVVQMQREGLVPLGMQPAEEERLLARAALHDHLERRRERSACAQLCERSVQRACLRQ